MNKKARRSGSPRLGESTLTTADWVEAALQMLSEAGIEALTVGALAARLGVTKGSFYWHFKSRDELLAAAIKRWEEQATTATTKGLDSVTDVHRRLELMLEAASQAPRSRSIYAALGEASGSRIVLQALQRVARARIRYLESCYRELGLTPAQAQAKALLAYAAYRGLLQLAHEAPGALPKDWSLYPGVVRDAMLPAKRAKAKPRKIRKPPAV